MIRALPLFRLALPLALLPLVSCSLVVDVPLPEQGSDADCDFLHRTKPDGVDDCMRWQFNPALLQCELVPLDEDNDGFFPAACLDHPIARVSADQVDCDDTSASGSTAFPGAPESCDGIDNDCDSKVDEGALVANVSGGPTVTFSGDRLDVDFAVDDDAANSVSVAYAQRGQSNAPGAVVRDRSFSAQSAERFTVFTTDANNTTAATPTAASIVSSQVAIASLGSNQHAMLFMNTSGSSRLVAGVVTQDRDKTFFAETGIFDNGLPCAPGDGDCSLTPPSVDSPMLAANGSDVLVTAVRRDRAETEDCDTTAGDVPVVGNLLEKRDFLRVNLGAGGPQVTFPALRLTTDNPVGLDLGNMRDDATPAVIGVPGYGFVVALPQANNRIVLRSVIATDGVYALDTSRDLVFGIMADEAPLQDPSLAYGTLSGTDDAPVLAMAFRRGCAGAGTVFVKLFDVDLSEGRLRVRNTAPRQLDGSGLSTAVSESRPNITFAREQRNTWFVAFIKQKNLRGRVLSFDGTMLHTESTTLVETENGISSWPKAFTTTTGAFGGARYGALFAADIGGSDGVYTTHLGCFSD